MSIISSFGLIYFYGENFMKKYAQTTSPQRTALRLVSTNNMSREEWLKVRRQGIGASDAASVGLSPYQSPLELWLIKMNEITTQLQVLALRQHLRNGQPRRRDY